MLRGECMTELKRKQLSQQIEESLISRLNQWKDFLKRDDLGGVMIRLW
jgi:hypothetical protein